GAFEKRPGGDGRDQQRRRHSQRLVMNVPPKLIEPGDRAPQWYENQGRQSAGLPECEQNARRRIRSEHATEPRAGDEPCRAPQRAHNGARVEAAKRSYWAHVCFPRRLKATS